MNQATIAQFNDFLLSRHYRSRTIRFYVNAIQDLDEPPSADNSAKLLKFVDTHIQKSQRELSRAGFNTNRAALNALFLMLTGMQIKNYRKQNQTADQYDSLIGQYRSYCQDFLHLTSTVTDASVRETRLFLEDQVPDLPRVVWSDITAKNVISFIENKRKNLLLSSLGVTVTAIRQFFRFLQHCDYQVHISILQLPLSPPNWSKNGKLPIVLTQEEQARLANHKFPDTATGRRDYAILNCFTEIGLRCSEVANLQLGDIKWHSGTIVIRKTKTHSERELPMSAKLGKSLEQYIMQARPKELGESLFYKSENRMLVPASPENIRSAIRRLYSKNSINSWHTGTHALRRTFGTHLYNAGNDLKTVADLLGHASLTTTKAYVRIDTESLRALTLPWPRRDGM